MGSAITFDKSNLPVNNIVLMATTDLFQGTTVQSAESPTWAYGINTNVSGTSTISIGFIPLQRMVNYGDDFSKPEDISGSSITLVSFLNAPLVEETAEASIFSLYKSLSGLPRYDLVVLFEDLAPSTQLIQEEQEEQETIRADTQQVLSFRDLVNALDRISRPTEIEDVPLPFDPDDYPVV